jgi:hypothetical protein
MHRVFVSAILLSASLVANGHHSFSAEFDSEKLVTVTGTVSEVRYRNPHVQYFIDVDKDSETTRWIIAAHSLVLMRRSGFTARTVSVGDEITASGYAGRNGAQKVYLETLDTPDGTRFEMYGEAVRRAGNNTAKKVVNDPRSGLFAQLIGDWAFDVDKEMPGAPLRLQFERDGEKLRAILDDEVIDVVVGQDSFHMILDRDNLAQFPAQLQLTGKMVDGAIAGSVDMVVGFSNYAELDAETFSASRTSAEYWQAKPPAPIAPVDLTGVWKRSIILGPIGRTNPHLNKAGIARHKEFQKGAYDPLLRCMSTGPMRRQARRGNMEILATTNRLTILYANSNSVRRIWLDRKEHSTTREHDEMGESLASWDGSTLVIDTRNLSASVLTQKVEPVSSDARIVERFWLDEADDLIMEATLHDPTYYDRPVVKRLKWTRTDDPEMLFPICDPDAFYRSLQFDGVLESYYENQPNLDTQ